jgi:hypothetical protein
MIAFRLRPAAVSRTRDRPTIGLVRISFGTPGIFPCARLAAAQIRDRRGTGATTSVARALQLNGAVRIGLRGQARALETLWLNGLNWAC